MNEGRRIRRILSIDGGGAKGVFPAAFLSSLDEKVDGDIASYFDLIVGTSTGGIIALGLGLGVSASEILDFYTKHSSRIFGDDEKGLLSFLTSRAKYNRSSLRSVLLPLMGSKRLGSSSIRLAIPSWNCTSRCPYIFKTAHHECYEYDHRTSALDVALATSAAPHYFNEYRTSDSQTFLDGGLYANNPLLVGITEAVGVLDWQLSDLRILSLGTTRAIMKKRRLWRLCLYGYLSYLLDQLRDAQETSTYEMARILLGGRGGSRSGISSASGKLFRIDHNFADGQYETDKTENLHELAGLGRTKARAHLDDLRDVFFTHPADPFTPLHKT